MAVDVVHTHTKTHTPTCAHSHFERYAKTASPSPMCVSLSVLSFFVLVFLHIFFIEFTFLLPFVFSTLLWAHNGKSSCPCLSSRCLMVCCSLWPLAVCLCTLCTCPFLTSNSPTHIQSVTHTNAHTSSCNTH